MLSAVPARRVASLRAILLAGLALALAIGLAALGAWQVERLGWKLDLIGRVEARVSAAPVAAPGRAEWRSISRDSAEYRHVRVSGRFMEGGDTAVLAVTEHGRGYWIITPLQTDDGYVVLVNRGFVPEAMVAAVPDPEGVFAERVEVAGLLRISEPEGGFLRKNDPDADRWYSRDVEEIARARALRNVAPYFIDADAQPALAGWPLGGLTVVSFPNNHLVYAVTWFVLALMTLGAGIYVLLDARRRPVPPEI